MFFFWALKRNCFALLREWRWLNSRSGQQAKRRRSEKRHRPQNRGHLGPEPLPYQVTTQKKVKQILHHFWNLPHRPSKVDQQIWVCQARVKPSQGGEQGQDGLQGDENFNRWDKNLLTLRDIDFVEFKLFWGRGRLGLKYLADCCLKIAQSGTPGPSNLASSIVR